MNADDVLDDEDETESMNLVGCPECEVYAVHEVVATPAAEVERANSLPDAVLECVACGTEFEAFDALEYNGE